MNYGRRDWKADHVSGKFYGTKSRSRARNFFSAINLSRAMESSNESHKWSSYFDEMLPENYRFADYYEYRAKMADFTGDFQKEADKLRKDLHNLIRDGPVEVKEAARRLSDSFKASYFFFFLALRGGW
jgi:hypothetical protein